MIESIDRAVLRAHQWVVDLTQRPAAWFVAHCAVGDLFMHFARFVAGEDKGFWEWLILFLCLLCDTWIYLLARSSVSTVLKAWSAPWFRVTFLALVVSYLCLFFVRGMPSPALGFSFVAEVLTTAIWYFAGCDEPAPPRRREQLQGSGA